MLMAILCYVVGVLIGRWGSGFIWTLAFRLNTGYRDSYLPCVLCIDKLNVVKIIY